MTAKKDFEIIESEIHKFKSKIKTKYNQDVYVIIKNVVHMSSLYDCVILTAQTHSPGFVDYLKEKKMTRLKEVVDYLYCFYHIAFIFGFTKSAIGKFSGRNHATVIHGINTANNRLQMNDKEFVFKYENIKQTVEEHVGPLSKSTKI